MSLVYGIDENHWNMYQQFKDLWKKFDPYSYGVCERERIRLRKVNKKRMSKPNNKEKYNKKIRLKRQKPENKIKIQIGRKNYYKRNKESLIIKSYRRHYGSKNIPLITIELLRLCSEINFYIKKQIKGTNYDFKKKMYNFKCSKKIKEM